MNQYQKNIFKGTIYSLLSGLIWGICGILGEFFFTHYPVSSGWITSMRLSLAGGFVLILSSFKFRSQLFDIWRKRKNYLPFLAYAILGIFSVQYLDVYKRQIKDESGDIEGIISDSVYLGLTTEYFVETAFSSKIQVSEESTFEEDLQKGDRIRLRINTQKLNVFSADGSQNLIKGVNHGT